MITRLIRLLFLFPLLASISPTTESTKIVDSVVKEASTQLVIDISRTVATVEDYFLCATLDWWPPSKCDYGWCPWGNAGITNLDPENPRLQKALEGLAPFMVRIGGTLQDLVVYEIGNLRPSEPCVPFARNESALFSFTGGCLSMERWDAINQLFMKTGIYAAFGLNALYGRSKSPLEVQVKTPWDSSNAKNFIRYTRDRHYPVIAWELGNELLGTGTGKSVSPELYAEDTKKLRNIIDNVYEGDASKPALVAPDSFFDVGNHFIPRFLRASGTGVVDVITRHIYNLGPGVTDTNVLINKVLDLTTAKREYDKYKSLETLLKDQPKTTAWVGESGGAYNSGHENVTNAFIMAFWYLDQLGTASKYNNQAFCRQSFVGGFYGLLDLDFNPNPDYYGALLWRQLMGKGVFVVDVDEAANDIRAYAHCQRISTPVKGGLTLLVLNYSNQTTYHLNLSLLDSSGSYNIPGQSDVRLEYHMSAPNGDPTSRTVLLNDQPLLVTPSGEIPRLSPVKVDSAAPISLAPLTYAYVVVSHASIPACGAA
ncbi:hypothetical protein R1sor_023553 [Riccia sorocarpa]|uniref:Heparanase n=1 Tax=Riccia sorocarpa TaxID=122646 RepID=A0ABD3GN05_9MARC